MFFFHNILRLEYFWLWDTILLHVDLHLLPGHEEPGYRRRCVDR